MEKILLALDGTRPNIHAVDFACWLGLLTGSSITAIYVENHLTDEISAGIEKNIAVFENTCQKKGNKYKILKYTGNAAKEIIAETRYADLLVIAAGTSTKKKFDGIPTTFVKNVLTTSECPVIIAPESFNGIDEIIFTCDGSKSSMFAMKQFCYLFPELNDKKVSLVQVNEDDTGTIEEKKLLKEWLSTHYSSIGFVTLLGDAEIELLAHLPEKKNIFIVMGAYGRSPISQYFRHSHAECLIEIISQAVFIAHR